MEREEYRIASDFALRILFTFFFVIALVVLLCG